MKSILEKLDEMAKRRNAATPGPWRKNEKYRGIIDGPENELALVSVIMRPDEDGAFIVAARTEHELLESALARAVCAIQIALENTRDEYYQNALREIETILIPNKG